MTVFAQMRAALVPTQNQLAAMVAAAEIAPLETRSAYETARLAHLATQLALLVAAAANEALPYAALLQDSAFPADLAGSLSADEVTLVTMLLRHSLDEAAAAGGNLLLVRRLVPLLAVARMNQVFAPQ